MSLNRATEQFDAVFDELRLKIDADSSFSKKSFVGCRASLSHVGLILRLLLYSSWFRSIFDWGGPRRSTRLRFVGGFGWILHDSLGFFGVLDDS